VSCRRTTPAIRRVSAKNMFMLFSTGLVRIRSTCNRWVGDEYVGRQLAQDRTHVWFLHFCATATAWIR
jgi:hypothetical protein